MKRMNIFSRMPKIAAIIMVCGLTPVAFTFIPGSVSKGSAAQQTVEQAINLHNAAQAGENGAAAKAVEAFKSLMQLNRDNALAVAYLGSSYAIIARDAGSVTDKIRFTNRGLRYLDQAVTMNSDNFIVRLVRANVMSNLPSMFGRDEMVVEDMLWLDRAYSAVENQQMAGPMTGIYAELNKRAPERGDWTSKLSIAQSIAAGN